MAANIGMPDRVLSIIIGLILIALVFVGPRTPWGWIGIIPLGAALINFCPLYALLGVRTRR